ncbi:MAG: CDP-alcohol phosphatidyltransferase family protein [Burkholderiales bacterium]|nr:CDP-alcohol phosphatidyltransferase family protein [Burkholderiales bacterium]OUT76349.1 MAG: hypothetical protein CBB82_08160 [Betaproteobacteria bacterium TMED22]|tara:strand:- start:3861 stop:4403 length:543 start_codon:yes stop_codon:yes gene_type:complete
MISALPNAITLGRLLSVPLLAILLSSHDYQLAFWIFLGLGLSDGLDGYIARRFNAISTAGVLLDPVADKLLVITSASMLAWDGLLAMWIGVPLVLRDIVMLSVGLLDGKLRETPVAPNSWGKFHAFLAFLAIGLAIGQAAGLFSGKWLAHLIWLILLGTLCITSVVYCLEWRRIRAERTV